MTFVNALIIEVSDICIEIVCKTTVAELFTAVFALPFAYFIGAPVPFTFNVLIYCLFAVVLIINVKSYIADPRVVGRPIIFNVILVALDGVIVIIFDIVEYGTVNAFDETVGPVEYFSTIAFVIVSPDVVVFPVISKFPLTITVSVEVPRTI